MEQILTIAINNLGFERVDELLAEMKHNNLLKKEPEKKAAKKKEEPEPEAEKKPAKKAAKKKDDEEDKKADSDEKTTKRISRMSPNLSKQLQTQLEKVGLKYNDDNKKDYDKIKKEFVSYIDHLTEDDFTAKGLADHMKDFADHKAPKGGDKPDEKVPVGPPKDAKIVKLSLDELKKIELLAVPDGDNTPAGVMWDAENGRWVTGPDEIEEEESDSVKFDGKAYAVGENTGRVYLIGDDEDTFVGFAGVGKFRKMKV